MKSLLIGAASAVAFAPAAIAGPYINLESNSGFVGTDYAASAVEAHIGADIELSKTAGAYLQVGPAFLLPDGGDSDTEFSGKTGLNVAVTDELGAYAEYGFMTAEDELASNVKLGLKYSF
jgi:opacity protein-like surface antigen|tara:strand:+ start:121 stop:480 length:360 start_codon:yes stop_codon:yes gene_type:complete